LPRPERKRVAAVFCSLRIEVGQFLAGLHEC
jgi:hypothetical protein